MERNSPFAALPTMCKAKQKNSCAPAYPMPVGWRELSSPESTVRPSRPRLRTKNSVRTSVRLFPRGAVQDHTDFLEGNQPALYHLVESRQDFFDKFRGFYDFQNDGKILREPKNLVGVIDARPAVPRDAAQDRHSREPILAQHLDNSFIERLAVPFVGLPDVNAHQRLLAFKFL